MSDKYNIIGKSLREAAEVLNSAEISFRITRRDKTNYVVTRDYRPERVNLQLDDGKVTSYTCG